MNILPRDRQIAVIAALAEGNSIRWTERLIGVHRDTIMRLGARIANGPRQKALGETSPASQIRRLPRRHGLGSR